MHNTFTFALVAKTLLNSKSYAVKPDIKEEAQEKTDASDVGQRLLNAFSVSIIFGITWVFGFLAVEEARGAFQLLFCIFNSFQGVLIFVLFCYAQKDVRRLLLERCCRESSPQPKPKKPKKTVDIAGNPITPGLTTSMSDSTRVSGESYSDDNDTLVTKVNDATLAMTTMESTEADDQLDQQDVPNKNTVEVEKNYPNESVIVKDGEILDSNITEETHISMES